MAGHEAAVRVANAELTTVREAMRELNRLVDALERGELEKVVLTQRNRMRAVLVSLERFSELERQAALDRRMAA
jgi:PHD/YefM family antitoxin component YafN of YafNO toxin-antitoxin module